jgi:hypothetical protein
MLSSTAFPLVDDILATHEDALGPDFFAYRNHVTRVLHFLFAIAPQLRDTEEQVLIAAAFHDLGIWTDRTFDYLAPSCRLAHEYLVSRGLEPSWPEVALIIQQHHKLRAYRGPFALSVESFRRADLVDVSLGLIRFGLAPQFVRSVRGALPNAHFHARLVALTGRQFLRSPLHPLPMVRW